MWGSLAFIKHQMLILYEILSTKKFVLFLQMWGVTGWHSQPLWLCSQVRRWPLAVRSHFRWISVTLIESDSGKEKAGSGSELIELDTAPITKIILRTSSVSVHTPQAKQWLSMGKICSLTILLCITVPDSHTDIKHHERCTNPPQPCACVACSH